MQAAFSDALAAADDELVVEVAKSSKQIQEAQQLRYRVYCEERGFEPGISRFEQDGFDPTARHVIVCSRRNRRVLGTVSVVMTNSADGIDGFPMQQACERWVLARLPLLATGEVSRFALARDRSAVSPGAGALIRLCLMQGVIRISREAKLTHLCAAMEQRLLVLLRATGIHFESVGSVVDYHGPRQPAVCAIATLLQRLKREQPLVWEFITDCGALLADSGAASDVQPWHANARPRDPRWATAENSAIAD